MPASFWNNREHHYRDNLARQAERDFLKSQVGWLKQFPIKTMVEFGWITGFNDPVDLMAEILNFFGIASPTQWKNIYKTEVNLRHTRTYESDPFALSAWLRKGEIKAQKLDCTPYDTDRFLQALNLVRELTTEPPEIFQPEIIRVCTQAGVAVAFVPELPKMHASGATRWLSPTKALLQVSLRYKTDDQLWFTFFHEAGHILKHGKRDVFIDDNGEPDRKEEEANRFAADFLIPPKHYRRFSPQKGHYSKAEINEFASQIGIAPGIVVGRLQHDGKLPVQNCNDLKQYFEWKKGV